MSWLDPIKPYWVAIRTCLWLALVAVVFFYGRGCGRDASAAEIAKLKTEHAQALAESATQLARLATDYRTREREMGEGFIAATAAHHKALTRVQTENARLVADLRSGANRLQDRWAGCVSASTAVAGRAGAPDAAADDRHRSAARIIGAADRCAADVIALQSILKAERMP